MDAFSGTFQTKNAKSSSCKFPSPFGWGEGYILIDKSLDAKSAVYASTVYFHTYSWDMPCSRYAESQIHNRLGAESGALPNSAIRCFTSRNQLPFLVLKVGVKYGSQNAFPLAVGSFVCLHFYFDRGSPLNARSRRSLGGGGLCLADDASLYGHRCDVQKGRRPT